MRRHRLAPLLFVLILGCTAPASPGPATATSPTIQPTPTSPGPAQAASTSPASPSPARAASTAPPSSASPQALPTIRPETAEALGAASIPFRHVSTGDWDNYAVKGQPPLSVLSSAAEARVLVAPDHKIEFTPARDLLTIDYAQETALFVVDRMHPCWYWLEVVAIEDVGDALEVHAVTWSPLGEGCLTAISQPFNIVAIPKTSKPIRLQPIGLDHEAFRPEARPTPPQR